MIESKRKADVHLLLKGRMPNTHTMHMHTDMYMHMCCRRVCICFSSPRAFSRPATKIEEMSGYSRVRGFALKFLGPQRTPADKQVV